MVKTYSQTTQICSSALEFTTSHVARKEKNVAGLTGDKESWTWERLQDGNNKKTNDL